MAGPLTSRMALVSLFQELPSAERAEGRTPLALPAGASAQQGTVSGVVTDQASGQPIVGARVGVVGTTLVTQTNAEGRYTLGRIPAGQVTLRVSAIGYAAGTPSVTVAAGERR